MFFDEQGTVEVSTTQTNEGGNNETQVAETPNADTENQQDANKVEKKVEPVRTFNTEQVNQIVKERMERQLKSLLKRYGVNERKELDDMIGRAQAYDVMKERYELGKKSIADLNEKVAFMENNIEPSRYEDIRRYFKGGGIEFSNDALKQELATHPEWLKVATVSDAPQTKIEVLGTDRGGKTPETEDERIKRIFGV